MHVLMLLREFGLVLRATRRAARWAWFASA
jgi:hypothetical protein